MIRRTLTTTVAATVLSAALTMGWTTVVAVIVLTLALCWVVADADRPTRRGRRPCWSTADDRPLRCSKPPEHYHREGWRSSQLMAI